MCVHFEGSAFSAGMLHLLNPLPSVLSNLALEPDSDDSVSCVIHFAVVASSHAATRILIWVSSFIAGRVRSRPIYFQTPDTPP